MSLELVAGQALTRDGGDKDRWIVPAIDARPGSDPTSADTMDVLRTPRRPDQRLSDWRRESRIRPVVFQDPGTIDQQDVHVHLEHRLVRRLLGRFTSQGFVHHDLSRACIARVKDSVRRVVIIGRLSVFGVRTARLHDEVVAVAAQWVDPSARKGPLKPYAERARKHTLDVLEAALKDAPRHAVPSDLTGLLAGAAERGQDASHGAGGDRRRVGR